MSVRLRDESGQALVESSILLAVCVGGLFIGGMWMARTHPQMLNALNIHIRGFYYLLSLPFP